MSLKRDENGVWTVELNEVDQETIEQSHPSYFDALPRYLTAFDPAFEHAREASEFNFLLSIFAVRGMQDAGLEAAMRADAMLEKGAMAGAAARRRIVKAVEELQRQVPAPRERAH